ncbi:cytochrome P450 [Streptomyces sp. NPDC003691]
MTATDPTPPGTDPDDLPFYPGAPFTGDPLPLPGEPVARVRLPNGQPVWLVTGYEEVRSALTHPLLSREAVTGDPTLEGGPFGGWTDGLRTLESDGEPHAQVRALAARPFTARRTARLRGRIQELTDTLLDAVAATGPPADLVAGLARPLPITVICELFGVPEGDRDRFATWSDRMMTMTGPGAELRADALRSLDRYLSALVGERRARPGDDVLSGWLAAEEGADRLTDAEIVRLARTVLIGGHETSENAIGAGIWRLLHHPGQLARLRDDPGLLPGAVEEILRYQPSSMLFIVLVARGDLELGGRPVRRGEGVMPLPYAANLDASRFARPGEFDIRRPPGRQIAFGHGPHTCLGAALARTELEVAIGTLLRRFPDLRPAKDLSALAWRTDRLVNGLRELPVVW